MSEQKYKDGSIEFMCDGGGDQFECEEVTIIAEDGTVNDAGWVRVKGSTVDDIYCPKCAAELRAEGSGWSSDLLVNLPYRVAL